MSEAVPEIRDRIGRVHVDTPYYEDVEAGPNFSLFWDEIGPFRPRFERLDLGNVVELACGHGRHSNVIRDRAGGLMLVDINQENIDFVRARFSGRPRTGFLVTAGADLKGLPDASYSALFSYDSMVHFEASDVIAYLPEIARVLAPGAMALLHYSNNQNHPEGSFESDWHWRSFFSEKMMRHFASRAGFEIVDSEVINWPPIETGVPNHDAVTLLRKP